VVHRTGAHRRRLRCAHDHALRSFVARPLRPASPARQPPGPSPLPPARRL
jgi:hypothetical protein